MTEINRIADVAVTAAMNSACDAAEETGGTVRQVIVIVTLDDATSDDKTGTLMAIADSDASGIDHEEAMRTLLGHAMTLAEEAGGDLRIFGVPVPRWG